MMKINMFRQVLNIRFLPLKLILKLFNIEAKLRGSFMLLGIIIGFSPPLFAETVTAPLLQKGNLVYIGAFRVPQAATDQYSFNYGGTSLAFNPSNNSLFMIGHDWYQYSSEITIPTLVNTSNLNSLPTASFLQPFKDPVEGRLNSINPTDPNSKKIGGQLVYNSKLYVTGYSYYDGAGTQSSSHFARPINLSAAGQLQGPTKVGNLYPGFVSGYMTEIPKEWQAQFGGPALTGNCGLAIAAAQSNGPAASVFDPVKVVDNGSIPASPVVGYPYGHQLGPGETTTNAYFNLATKIRGIVFPSGTRSILFFGRQGLGPYCYGDGASCGDPADNSKGTHAYPYKYQVWAYDANDLLSVKNGVKQQYQIQPYAVWNFNLPFENASGQHQIGGAAYDPKTNFVYLSQQCEDTNCAPIIHAFRVLGATDPGIVPPTNLRIQ